jgi:exosortase
MTVESAIQRTTSVVSAETQNRPPGPIGWLTLGAGGLVLALFGQRFLELKATWDEDRNYSHGYLVPFVSAYLAYLVWQRQGSPRRGNFRAGIAWLGVGCLLHLFAVVVWYPPVDFVALTSILYGFAVLAGGRQWARGFRFPILFLFFLFPLPAALTNDMAVWLQGTVTTLATHTLGFFVPVHREGNFIQMAGGSMEVGEACSGLRMLIAFAALTLIVVHLSQRSLLFRALLLCSAPLVAIAANLIRVLLMAVVLRNFGLPYISGAFHDAWGLVALALALGLLLGVAWWLARVLPEPDLAAPAAAPEAARPAPPSSGVRPGLLARRLGVAVACLAITLAGQGALLAHLHAGGPLPEPPELTQSLSHVSETLSDPVSPGAWSGVETDPARLPSNTQEYLQAADDKVCRDYTLDDGRLWCRLWVIHFRDGTDRQHHPEICYKVAGAVEDPAGRDTVDVGDPKAKVARFCYTTKDGPSYVYYWHYTLEPEIGPELSLLQRFYLRRTQRLPSVTVEVFTNARSPTDLDRSANFVRQADRELRLCLPPGARMGSDILPIRYTGAPRHGLTH